MFSPWVRIALVAVGLLLGVRELEDGNAAGWVPIGAALLLLYGHVRYGTVRWAFEAVRRGADGERVRRRLAGTMFPRLLNAQSRAYYVWLRGGIALKDGDADGARRDLREAFSGRLRTPRDRALVALTLARMEREAGDPAEALRWVGEARAGLPEDELRLALEELELDGPATSGGDRASGGTPA